jgi:hypothetical protein
MNFIEIITISLKKELIRLFIFASEETIFITLKKTTINVISKKCDSMYFIILGEPLLGRRRDSG